MSNYLYTIFSMVFIILVYYLIVQNQAIKALSEARKKAILEDLELATSDQLISELRSRHGFPYLMLFPKRNNDSMGVTVDIHNIKPELCVEMLHMAAFFIPMELKKRGFNPGFKNPDDESGEEWKQGV